MPRSRPTWLSLTQLTSGGLGRNGPCQAPSGPRPSFRRDWESGEGRGAISFVLDNMKARVYGEAAAATGRMTSRADVPRAGYQRAVSMHRRVHQEGRAGGSVSPHTYRGSRSNNGLMGPGIA